MTKWGPCNNQHHSNVLVLKSRKWRPRQSSRKHDDCVCDSGFWKDTKKGQWRNCFPLYGKSTPFHTKKKYTPTVATRPPALDFCTCPGLGSCWPWRRSALSTFLAREARINGCSHCSEINCSSTKSGECWLLRVPTVLICLSIFHPKTQHKLK